MTQEQSDPVIDGGPSGAAPHLSRTSENDPARLVAYYMKLGDGSHHLG